MHYKNGREAKAGDKIVGRSYDGTPFAGVIVNLTSTGDTCNISVLPIRQNDLVTLTAKECLHIDDALPKD